MFDFESVLNQAKEIQGKLKLELEQMAVTSQSGGGMVRVVVNGSKELTKIEFEPEALKDPDLLADLVLAALNGAYEEVDRRLKDKMPTQMNNMDLSGIMELFKK